MCPVRVPQTTGGFPFLVPPTFTQNGRLLPESDPVFTLVLRQFDPQTGISGRFVELTIFVPAIHRGSDPSGSLTAFKATGPQGGLPRKPNHRQ